MKYRFLTCDVFTTQRFGGNPLAVLPEADGLSGQQMQQIAREFNYSETAFVLPPERGHSRRVRIFTPTREVPFAGHPNIGTAFTLAEQGLLGTIGATGRVCFEEQAGLVEIAMERRDSGKLWCELAAPEQLTVGEEVASPLIAEALSLQADQLVLTTHRPCVASVGLPFLFAELVDREALAQARGNISGLEKIAGLGITPDVFAYCRSNDGFDICARMFAPFDGVPEDPATGSANCALAGLLSSTLGQSGMSHWLVAQGVEMGRPSALNIRAERQDGRVTGTWVGGHSVAVADGWISVDP